MPLNSALEEYQEMKLPVEVRIRGAGMRSVVANVEEAIELIDKHLPDELAKLPRWTFARALLVEALRSGKSRDMKAAVRQLQQAVRNEKWS
jgi:hypothetical protein